MYWDNIKVKNALMKQYFNMFGKDHVHEPMIGEISFYIMIYQVEGSSKGNDQNDL